MEVSFAEKIFESNFINLVILDIGLFYLVGNALSENLADRHNKILESIKESEKKLKEAVTHLTESENQLLQTEVVIESIIKESKKIANQIIIDVFIFTISKKLYAIQ